MNKEIVQKFWRLLDEGKFDEVGTLMHENAVVRLPNTREVFKSRDKFIIFNKKYPGLWSISLEKIFSQDDIVISVVKVESGDKQTSAYATSFFTVKDSLIQEITEYWGDNGEPPQWRIKESLSDRY